MVDNKIVSVVSPGQVVGRMLEIFGGGADLHPYERFIDVVAVLFRELGTPSGVAVRERSKLIADNPKYYVCVNFIVEVGDYNSIRISVFSGDFNSPEEAASALNDIGVKVEF